MAPWAYTCRLLTFLGLFVVFGHVKSDTPCYLDYCYCKDKLADCSNNQKALTIIPDVSWESIETFLFRYNYLPNITTETFKNITNFSILHLNMKGNQIQSISSDAFSNLTKLKRLDLSNNVIHPKALASGFLGFPRSLNYLYLNNMSLVSLPLDIFMGLRNTSVEGIHLMYNNLTDFNLTVTRSLNRLTTLNLKFNQISSLDLTTSNTLGTLWLSYNQLETFPNMCAGGLSIFPELWTLSLEFNNITDLTSSNFDCLTNLRKLLLSGNHFTTIYANTFVTLNHLHTLSLSRNSARDPKGLLHLQKYAFNNTKLTFLNLSSSGLSSVPVDIFNDIPVLTKLDYSHNKIDEHVFSSMLQKNTLLQVIYCRSCGLTSIPDIFKKMRWLQYMFLDDNSIEVIPNHFFDYNVQLSHLSMRNNNIGTVSGFAITYSLRYNLQYFSLEANPFICDCRLLWLKDWINKDKNLFKIWGQYLNYKCARPPNYKGQMLLNVGIVSDKVCLLQHSPFTTVAFVAGTVFVILLVFGLLYKWRWKISYCCIKRKTRRSVFTGEGRPLLSNDAYVVYCDENYHPWIRRELMPNIEGQRSFKLGIRQRDFDQSHHKVSNIVENLRNCRKVIVVLSNSFFKDSESQDELSLVLKCIEDQRGVLVVILLEEIDDRYMSCPLYCLLQKTELLRWPTEPRQMDVFWRSLASSLEDPNLHSFS